MSILANLSTRTKLRMSGPDRERYLGGQITNDVRDLQPGSPALYACVTNAKGKLEADLYITAIDDAYLIDADASLRESLLARLDKYIIADDVTLEDVTDENSLFHATEGPTPVGLSNTSGALVSTCTRFGSEGSDFWFTPAATPSGIAFTPETAIKALRISQGIPQWGAELTPEILPPEAGPAFVERTISYTKGCYVGQEVISRIRSVGKVNKQLVTLRADDPDAAFEPGLELFTENSEKPIGTITSCAVDPAIALAYVKTAHAEPGTRLTAGIGALELEILKSPLDITGI